VTDPSELTEPLLRPRDVAEMANVSDRTVRRLSEQGRLPAVRVGGQLRFARADVELALRPRRREPNEARPPRVVDPSELGTR
jgi:excisionase family DNA binding protein